ncbi:MAG: hypothetical protein P8Y68_03175 [Anaerolineales bacterium]
MKRRYLTIFWTVVISLVFTGVVYASNDQQTDTAATVVSILAPLAAAALGIERGMEILWGIVESIGDMFKKQDQPEEALPGPGGEDWKNSPKYKQFKTWFSAFVSLILGIVIAFQTNLMMFTFVGFENVVPNADKFVTGIVVGSGSKFTHDVIGIFSEGKKFVEHAQGLVKARKDNETEGE